MITIRKSEHRGHADHGWLDARHSFSFADFVDPDYMGFSELRVLNQDRIQPARGFSTHGHRDMEIVTYVLSGVLEHRDDMGNGSLIRPGEVQLMSAGRGVRHSEFNASQDELLELLQMWVLPARKGTTPRYEQKEFPGRHGTLCLVASPDGRGGSLTIGQDVLLHASVLAEGQEFRHEMDSSRCAWLHLARGRVLLNGIDLAAGDGAAIRAEARLELECREAAELVLFDLP